MDQGAAHDAGVAALTGARPGKPGAAAFALVYGLLDVGAVALLALLSVWPVSAVNRSLRSVSPARLLRHAIVPALLGSLLAATFWSAVFALVGLSAGFEGFLPRPIAFASAPDITVAVVLTTLLIAARGYSPRCGSVREQPPVRGAGAVTPSWRGSMGCGWIWWLFLHAVPGSRAARGRMRSCSCP